MKGNPSLPQQQRAFSGPTLGAMDKKITEVLLQQIYIVIFKQDQILKSQNMQNQFLEILSKIRIENS